MNKSEEISQLALALSKLQSEVKDVLKDKKGYGYYYADLASILEEVRPLMSKYKLAITQLPGTVDDKVSLETVLMHESGQWISSVMQIPLEKSNKNSAAQCVGSVLTYARRYALAAFIGLAQTDTDADDTVKAETNTSNDAHTAAFVEVRRLIAEQNINSDTINKWLAWAKVNVLSQCTLEQLNAIISKIKNKE